MDAVGSYSKASILFRTENEESDSEFLLEEHFQ